MRRVRWGEVYYVLVNLKKYAMQYEKTERPCQPHGGLFRTRKSVN